MEVRGWERKTGVKIRNFRISKIFIERRTVD